MGLGYVELLIEQQIDGPALAAAAAASMLPAASKKTIPANFFDKIGKKMLIRASGRISSVITNPGTARFDVRMTGTIVFDSLAILLDTVAAHTNVGWNLEIELTCRAIGAAGNLYGRGRWECEDILGTPAASPKGVLAAILPWNTFPAPGANFDTTVAQIVDVFFTQTLATGSFRCDDFSLWALN